MGLITRQAVEGEEFNTETGHIVMYKEMDDYVLENLVEILGRFGLQVVDIKTDRHNFGNVLKFEKDGTPQPIQKPKPVWEEPIEEDDPYCLECGNGALIYITQYANGEEWRCRNCDHTFVW